LECFRFDYREFIILNLIPLIYQAGFISIDCRLEILFNKKDDFVEIKGE